MINGPDKRSKISIFLNNNQVSYLLIFQCDIERSINIDDQSDHLPDATLVTSFNRKADGR